MNSHQKNKPYFFLFVILIIIVFSLPWTRNILFSVGSPLWSIKNGIGNFFTSNAALLASKKAILKENLLLKEQITADESKLALYDLLKKENDNLKSILNVKPKNQNLLLSSVLVKPSLSPYDTLVIDNGSTDGIKVNDKVLSQGNVYIGFVSEVYSGTSKVVLYSSPGEKTRVIIDGNNIEKEAVGLGGGNFSVEIPREIDINIGDPIIIPFISTNIFGVVEKIKFKESDSFQNIFFKSPINISELKWVEVQLSNK